MLPQEEIMDDMTANIENLEKSVVSGLDVEQYYMSDTQCAKMVLQTRHPELTDSDLNLVVFGTDIESEMGAAYVPFVSEKNYVIPPDKEEEEEPSTDNTRKKKKSKLYKKEKVVQKDKDSPFKPLDSNSLIYDEVKKIKDEFKKSIFLLKEKSVDLGIEAGTTTTLVATSIPGMIAMMAPPTFNIPGAISLLMLALNNLKGLQSKVKEIAPLLFILQRSNMIIMPDKLKSVVAIINGIVTALNAVSRTINAFSIISQAKITSLKDAQTKMDNLDKELKALSPQQFGNDSQYQAAKKAIETKKETLSKQAQDALKA
jgi:hypothetical protein